MRTEKTQEERDILQLSSKLIYQRYQMNKTLTQNFFNELSIPEYIALRTIVQLENRDGRDRTYLKELASIMHLTIQQASRITGSLRDRGMVLWSHDGNGSEGTYMILTDFGKEMLERQEKTMTEYFGKVISRFGKENLIRLLELTKQMEEAVDSEMKESDDTKESGES